MNDAPKRPLLVEAFLKEGRVSGVSRKVEERRRLIDLLNGTDPIIELESARYVAAAGREPRFYPALSLEKRSIVAAVPRETQDQSRLRSAVSQGMGRLTAQRTHLALVVPPLCIEGVAYVAIGGGELRAGDIFAHFFAISEAAISLSDGASVAVSVVIINRDYVAGLSRLGNVDARISLGHGDPAVVDSILSWFPGESKTGAA